MIIEAEIAGRPQAAEREEIARNASGVDGSRTETTAIAKSVGLRPESLTASIIPEVRTVRYADAVRNIYRNDHWATLRAFDLAEVPAFETVQGIAFLGRTSANVTGIFLAFL